MNVVAQRLADSARDRQAKSARSGGRQTEIRFAVGDCALGAVLLARNEWGVCAILFGDDREALPHELKARSPQALLRSGDPGTLSGHRWGVARKRKLLSQERAYAVGQPG